MAQRKSPPAGHADETEPVPVQRLHLWQIQAVRDALWVAALIFLIWIGYAMRAVTVPLLVALLLAYLFEPVVARTCEDYPKLKRPWVVAGLMCSLIAIIVLVLVIIAPLIVGQTVRLVRDLRGGQLDRAAATVRERLPTEFVDDFDSAMVYFNEMLGVRPAPLPARVRVEEGGAITDESAPAPPDGPPVAVAELTDAQLQEMIRAEVAAQLANQEPAAGAVAEGAGASRITSWASLAKRSVNAILGFLGRVLQVGFLLFLIPFYFFFFSMWYPRVLAAGRELIPPRSRARTLELLSKMDRAVAGFVRGRIVICLLIGLMLAVGWSICTVPYAIVLGLIIGIFSIVPYLGGVGVPLAIILLWVKELGQPPDQQMSALWIIGGPVLVFVIMQIIETYILTPIIAGKATNLDPVTILVAVIAGGSVGGVYGMLLAIPAAACLKIIFTDVLLPRLRAWLKGEAEDPLPIGRA